MWSDSYENTFGYFFFFTIDLYFLISVKAAKLCTKLATKVCELQRYSIIYQELEFLFVIVWSC